MSKRGIRCTLLVVLMSLTFSMNSYAAELPARNLTDTDSNEAIIKAEQVRWVYRKHNGVKQKRLWSLTYGYWKTDWINV